MTLFLASLHAVILYFLVRWIIGRIPDRGLTIHGWLSVALKILAGWGLGALYLYHYDGADTWSFHQFGSDLADIGRMDFSVYFEMLINRIDPPQAEELLRSPRLYFMVKITSLLHLFTGNNYWITSAYMSVFCWIGLFSLSAKLSGLFPARRWLFIIAGLYLPSVLFWASGLTKESIAMAAFGFFVSAVTPTIRFTTIRVVQLVAAAALLYAIKYYFLVPLLLAVSLYFLVERLGSSTGRRMSITLGLIMVLLAGWFFAFMFNPNLAPNNLPKVIFENYSLFQLKSDPGDTFILPNLCPQWGCILESYVPAVWNALFRPYFWESTQFLKILAGTENLFFFLMGLYFVYDIRNLRHWSQREWAFVTAALLFILLVVGFLGLSAPNFGTLARYRSIVLPVLVVLCCRNLPLEEVKKQFISLFSRSS